MKSMFTTYAMEQKNKDGSPSGKFFMNEAQTKAAATEVLVTNKGLGKEAVPDYLEKYFKKAWDHYDVNGAGMLEIEVIPQFMRLLAGD